MIEIRDGIPVGGHSVDKSGRLRIPVFPARSAISGSLADESFSPAPVVKTATTIEWESDAIAAQYEGVTDFDMSGYETHGIPGLKTDIPEVDVEVEKAVDSKVEPVVTTNEVVKAADDNLSSDVAAKVKKAVVTGQKQGGLEGILTELNSAIEKENKKRDAIAMLAFGIALMGGKNATAAASFASQLAGTSDEKVEKLYARRKPIMDAITDTALREAGYMTNADLATQIRAEKTGSSSGSADWNNPEAYRVTINGKTEDLLVRSGNAGTQVLHNGQWKDVTTLGASIGKKSPTGGLSATQDREIKFLGEEIRKISKQEFDIDKIVFDINKGELPWSGRLVGGTNQWIRDLFGTQSEGTLLRTRLDGILKELALINLPPGAASNKDVELVLGGVPSTYANEATLKRFFNTLKDSLEFAKEYAETREQYIARNETVAGFPEVWKQNPVYQKFQRKYPAGGGTDTTTNTGKISSDELGSIIDNL